MTGFQSLLDWVIDLALIGFALKSATPQVSATVILLLIGMKWYHQRARNDFKELKEQLKEQLSNEKSK